ncbi:multicopper oxidase domain-containing protein [Kocuria varians]|uniref:Copper-containing nitrite reductase n=1 Tax=Kocuria varians TaxID=1272 RepID=A0A7D7Q2N1_KOCVA|nr:multicopper oxidase domain-containing protein [Kocuria varians]QMS56341.1 Copper-containing nitrite reductase [Kocuria varians]
MPSPAATERPPAAKPRRGRSWHRTAGKPVRWWLVALVVVIGVHRWIPETRWLMVHMVTLGLITTSIMVWSQHFTEALLHHKLPDTDRPRQIVRIYGVTAGTVLLIAGMLGGWWWLTVVAATVIGAMLTWHGLALLRQPREALPARFGITVRWYATASFFLPVGAIFGAILARDLPAEWHARLLLAHQAVNVLGFVGLTVSATLLTLWPTILRTRMRDDAVRLSRIALPLMAAGSLLSALFALTGHPVLTAAGLALYTVGAALVGVLMLRTARRRRPEGYMGWSLASGVAWLVVTSALAAWLVATRGLETSVAQTLTVPFVAGFLVQTLFGAMSYILPSTMGGGPATVRASLAAMNRAGVYRATVANLCIALFALPAGVLPSWVRALVSIVGAVVLAAFIPLMISSAKVSVAARRRMVAERAARASSSDDDAAPHAAASPSRPGQAGSVPTPSSSGEAVPANAGHGGRSSRTVTTRGDVEGSTMGQGVASSVPAGHGGGSSRGASTQREGDGSARRQSAASSSAGGVSPLTQLLAGVLTVVLAVAAGIAIAPQSAGFSLSGGGGSAAEGTGETTEVTMHAREDMRFDPSEIRVPRGNRLVITLVNEDPSMVHDLVFANGATSGRLDPGATATVDVGVVTDPLDGWCSVIGHRSMGMTVTVVPVDENGQAVSGDGTHDHSSAAGGAAGSGTAAGSEADPAQAADLNAAPGKGFTTRSPVMEPASEETVHRVTLDVQEVAREVAPGVTMDAWTYNGQYMGPTLRGKVGDTFEVTLENHGSMGHSVDFHAGDVSPDEPMRTIVPGESLVYRFTAQRSGIWLYHCSSMPMSTHVAAGMFGAVVIDPPDLPAVDREYLLVQNETYLSAPDENQPDVPEGAGAVVDPEKIKTGQPTFTMFNGHATQYMHAPLTARPDERVRIWVLAAGPSMGLSFHVVGGQFDTVYKEGAYQLTPSATNNPGGTGGAQALDLASAQGGFVELSFPEAGTYTFVNHSFAEAERGAKGLIRVAG